MNESNYRRRVVEAKRLRQLALMISSTLAGCLTGVSGLHWGKTARTIGNGESPGSRL
jgi:hypothetical protein